MLSRCMLATVCILGVLPNLAYSQMDQAAINKNTINKEVINNEVINKNIGNKNLIDRESVNELSINELSINKQSINQFEASIDISDDAALALSLPSILVEQPRVVALNWTAAEMLLSLGIKPVAMTSKNGYRTWQSNHPAIPDSVREVGNRAFPSLPVVLQQQPDLIIGYPFRHARLINELKLIAPTLLLQQFARFNQPNYRYMQQMRENYLLLAERVGKQTLAKQQLAEMDTELTRLSLLIIKAGLHNKKIAYGKFVGMGYGLRVFSQQSLAASIASHLGLNYQWDMTLPGKDFTHLQLEQIKLLQDTALILVQERAGVGERMMLSPLWAEHDFVKNKDIYTVSSLWSFGGPVSVIRMARAFTKALLEQQHDH
ncbi:iron-siderophore ABC transporter substrate-binding protein [Psychromonas arctica]|uniref:ABC transporter substrate-binding protein n=1 Tax=Psychromonas arctica TaxID=168275 RepID=UPI0004015829|nr:iron-siderophore ABC transporter substrate-binding protein [Psychromonas arctica]